jgi:hypothetical protein
MGFGGVHVEGRFACVQSARWCARLPAHTRDRGSAGGKGCLMSAWASKFRSREQICRLNGGSVVMAVYATCTGTLYCN